MLSAQGGFASLFGAAKSALLSDGLTTWAALPMDTLLFRSATSMDPAWLALTTIRTTHPPRPPVTCQ